MLKILIISAADLQGGAAKVAYDLSAGLMKLGHHVELHATHCTSRSAFVKQLPKQSNLVATRFGKVLYRMGLSALNLNSSLPYSLGKDFLNDFDIIHLHDLPSDFNYAALPWLSRRAHVVWTQHAMTAFTGGCSYSYDCERFKRYCGNCPQFGKWPLNWLVRDGSRWINLSKRWFFFRSQITAIGVSNWIAQQAKEGILKNKPIRVIPNPVNINAFSVLDKAIAKRTLGIAPDRFTILFAAAGNTMDTRKGLDIILQALLRLQGNPFLLPMAVTPPDAQFRGAMERFDSLPPQHLKGNRDLAKYYQAADVVWHPTRADTSSLVSLEAFACGTPVIAAAVGGVPEIVRNGMTGRLIPVGDPVALAEATHELMGDVYLRQQLGKTARKFVETHHSEELFITRHLDLYSEILAR